MTTWIIISACLYCFGAGFVFAVIFEITDSLLKKLFCVVLSIFWPLFLLGGFALDHFEKEKLKQA